MVVLGTPGLVREHHGGHGARCIASALCAISPAAIRAGTEPVRAAARLAPMVSGRIDGRCAR